MAPSCDSGEGMTEHTCPGYLDDPPELQKALDDSGYWMPCEHPERPIDVFMVVIAVIVVVVVSASFTQAILTAFP